MIKRLFLCLTLPLIFSPLISQVVPVPVPRIYSKPVLVHYMPWFNTPEFSSNWGWHWTMNNRDPDVVIDTITGRRDIASHYYPMIGPYASIDPDVIEYHLLLMKYAGIDGVLIDWYGEQGRNGDVTSLLNNSNALIDRTDEVGLEFSLIIEDRFWDSIPVAQNNMAYVKNNYLNRPNYFRVDSAQSPLMGIFGPITFETEAEWDSILPALVEDPEFLTLWYQSNDMGSNADGEYVWIYEVDSLNDWHQRLVNFYSNRAGNQQTAMAVAYPGFKDFYAQGGAGNGYFVIPHNGGTVLDSTLNLLTAYDSVFDIVQLATWNDFGEGTIFEPTWETGYDYLVQLQQFLGVPFSQNELENIHRLYTLRKEYAGDSLVQEVLDEVFDHFVMVDPSRSIYLMDSLQGMITGQPGALLQAPDIRVFPNPAGDRIFIETGGRKIHEVQITDILGKQVSFHRNSNRIEWKDLVGGIYFVRIRMGDIWHTKKILKQ